MLENTLTETQLIDKYELLLNWFEYGSMNHIETVIGFEVTRRHLSGCKSSPEYKMKLGECIGYFNKFSNKIGDDMPLMVKEPSAPLLYMEIDAV